MHDSGIPVGEPDPPPHQTTEQSSIYKVPRRFDLATIFVVTFAYAAFFGVMEGVGVPTEVQLSIIGLLSLVGAVQMIVSEKHVRFAAIACGWFACASLLIYEHLVFESVTLEPCCMLGGTLFVGSLLGYCSGVIVAGVFLVSDSVRAAVNRLRGSQID